MRKFLSVIAILLVAIMLFTACDFEEDVSDGEETEETEKESKKETNKKETDKKERTMDQAAAQALPEYPARDPWPLFCVEIRCSGGPFSGTG